MNTATRIAALVAASVLPASLASAGFIAHFSNGRQIWTSTNSGATFTNSGAVTSKIGGSGFAVGSVEIVGLGYHSPSNTFYATGDDGWLYSVAGLGTANVSITGVQNLSSNTISFDFFGNTFRGVRGDDLIELNITAPAAPTVVNANIGASSVPATGRIGTDFFGTTTNGAFFKINSVGPITPIGNTGQGGYTVAGGSSDGSTFYAALGYNPTGNNDPVRFGSINHLTGAFNLISTTDMGANSGSMGMVVVSVIPLPHAGGLATAGLLGLAAIRRRTR